MNRTALELGSAEHRRLLARFFLDSHLDDSPERIERLAYYDSRLLRPCRVLALARLAPRWLPSL